MTKSALLAILGGVVVAAAITLNFVFEDADPEAPVVHPPPPPSSSTPSQGSAGKGLTLKPEPKQASTPTNPSFDVVRINPAGDTVMAGRAAPGGVVEIYDGGKKIGEVTADKRGEWVFVPTFPLPPGSRQLSLKMINPDGTKTSSETDVLLVVPERGKDIAGRPAEKESQPLAVKLPSDAPGQVEVLQTPNPQEAGDKITLTVDAVDYNDRGKLTVAGKAPASANVYIYLNNQFQGRSSANGHGIWNLSPKDPVAPGVYTLRADQIGPRGKVIERREVVFARSVPLTDLKPGSLVVIEPGNSLWRIARHTYGSGLKFTVIYEANRDQIKNADLIFPGQIFTLPSLN